MSHRPAQQTERDERDALLLELGVLSAEKKQRTGEFPEVIQELKTYENSDRIDFRELSNDDLAYLCERVRASY
jgi:hypothetical protein